MRAIDYIYRNKIKRFIVKVPIEEDENGDKFIRLEWVNYNPNINGFEWVKFKEGNLIKEYCSEDEEYINILKVWVRFMRFIVKNKGKSLGIDHYKKFWKDSLNYHNLKNI